MDASTIFVSGLILLIIILSIAGHFIPQAKNNHESQNNGKHNNVVITDIKMPFTSMVVFMVKWAVASIPALIILSLFFVIMSTLLTRFL